MEIIIKPTGSCNGNCVYCSAIRGQEKGNRLPTQRLGSLFEILRSWLVANPQRVLRFIWHGGEPLLCGLDFFRTVAAEERRVFGEEMGRVKNMMQSNLSLLTPDWIPVLKDLIGDQTIGTSFDIVPGIRGLKSGDDLARLWVRAIHLLRNHGLRVGVVYVVHKRSLALVRDVYHFFRNLNPSMGLRFNALYREGLGDENGCEPLWITPEEYARFMIEICDLWADDGWQGSVNPLTEWKRAWNGEGGLCCDSLGRCGETHLAIDADGTVYGCGRMADGETYPLGNVFHDAIDVILTHPERVSLRRRSELLRNGACRNCRFWSLCHGGCPSEAWLYYRDLFHPTYFCPGRKLIFEHFEKLWGPLRAKEVATCA